MSIQNDRQLENTRKKLKDEVLHVDGFGDRNRGFSTQFAQQRLCGSDSNIWLSSPRVASTPPGPLRLGAVEFVRREIGVHLTLLLATSPRVWVYGTIQCMISIRFPDHVAERKAIGFLVGRFSCKSFSDGTTLVPESALAALAREGVSFIVEGPATYEQCTSAVRDSASPQVQ